MDDLLIVKAKEILVLAKFRRLWILGWMAATAALVVAAIQTSRLLEAEHQQEEIRVLTQQVASVTARQQVVNDSILQTLEQQNQTADLLISWGTYVKARADVSRLNLNTPQFATTGRPK